MMKKKSFTWDGRNYFLIGTDGTDNYYLEEASFDCDWYWGGGYVETFSNKSNPKKSKDITSHNHFDNLIFNVGVDGYTAFKKFFKDSPLEDSEIWTLLELMKTFYTMRTYSDTLYRGGSHYTSNKLSDTIKNKEEYDRINKIVIPAIMDSVYSLLGGVK